MVNAIKRVTIVMLDSLGVGEQPDAKDFGQFGHNTIRTVATQDGGISLPHFQTLGLGNLTEIPGVPPNPIARAAYGRMQEQAAGNDTFAGIWEMVGLPFRERFSTYDQGLPLPLLNAVEDAIGRKVLGNCYGPGSELKRHYADEHRATGHPILYTSDDGVVQIAAHEEVILPEELYKMAERMTEVLRGHGVARIIARPFIGQEGKYKCTDQRADFPVPTDMPEEILLDLAARHGVPFIATSHIRDLFSTRAVTESIHIADNADGISKLLGRLRQDSQGIMFFGLLDFDEYGHKKDPCGYARALEAFDMHIPDLIQALRDYDMLVFTADHGTALTSYEHVHTREYVPLLVLGPRIMIGVNLGIRQTFADLGQTIADILSLGRLKHGKSFADAVICYQRPDIVH